MMILRALRRCFVLAALSVLFLAPSQAALAQEAPKPATAATKAANQAVQEYLNFDDKQDFEDAQRGFIDRPATLTIKDANGNVVWDLESYKQYIGVDKVAPDTVNPSLWRNAQLNMMYGLFKVTDRIYQVRGYDLSNVTFIQGDTGWIVGDPLISQETAKAAFDLVTKNLGQKPVVAVVYSHSHIDHYGGVRGIVDEADVKSGKVKIIAPQNFLEEAVSENVIAGNAMGRRAVYMYGAFLPKGPKGQASAGLGLTNSLGTQSLLAPTDTITHTRQKMTIDGLEVVFQLTPGTEAPAEMNFYFPQLKALCMAENLASTFHNVLTLRGAKVRDPLQWSSYIQEAIDLFSGEAAVVFTSHHWPKWGRDAIVNYMTKQRDLYKYIHDQAVRLLNQGYTIVE